jgi:DNA-binding MarR family transcriptional regulator
VFDLRKDVQYIRFMSNMSKITLSADQWQFIDDLAELLYPWGMQPGVARLYGLLLLQPDPVGLEGICGALAVSKSTASVTSRQLERAKLVKRHAVRGSKRVLYSVVDNNAATVAEQALMLGNFATLLTKAAVAADSSAVAARLRKTAGFCDAMQGVMEEAIHKFSGH